MKSILSGLALLACLAAPALAEDSAPAPTAPAVTIPGTEAVIPAILPQPSADESAAQGATPLPASQPLPEGARAMSPMGGGCHHGSGDTVYLTN